MEPGKQFTPEEDMTIWRFAMFVKEGYGRTKMWSLYKNMTGSERDIRTLRRRFQNFLLPHLQNTKFHTETKLKWCQEYNLVVESDFLEDLQKDAEVQVDSRGLVTGWQLKPGCPENRDMNMSDEEFLEVTAPLSRRERRIFNEEEDKLIMSYVLENLDTYTKGKSQFWTEMSNKLGNRRHDVLIARFQKTLAPNLHSFDLSIENQLKIYKTCQIPVKEEHLPILHERAELEIIWGNYIKNYKLRSEHAEKRKSSEDTDGDVKKVKLDDSGGPLVTREEEELQQQKSPKNSVGDYQYLFDQFFAVSDDVPEEVIGRKKEEFEKVFFPSRDDTEPVVQKEDQSKPMARILEVVKRMEQKIAEQEESIEEMKKYLAESVNMMSNVMNSLEEKITDIRNEIIGPPDDDTTAINKKNYLLNFKKFVSSIKSPEMNEIRQKIETALQNLPENDEGPLPLKAISGVFEVALSSIDN